MLNPETWTGIALVAGAVVRHLGGVAWDRRKAARNGNSNGYGHDSPTLSLLRDIKREVSDREGSVRTHGHHIANALQAGIGRLELIQAQDARVEKHLEKIAETLGAIRLEAAERGNCCEHCR